MIARRAELTQRRILRKGFCLSGLIALLALILLPGTAVASLSEVYEGDSGAGDLDGSILTNITFDTDTLQTVPATETATLVNVGSEQVAVFRYNNVTIPATVGVFVQGSRPLSIVAAGDMIWGATINVPAGQLGGGVGGAGGAGGTGAGQGGAGAATGGVGGAAVAGGAAGGANATGGTGAAPNAGGAGQSAPAAGTAQGPQGGAAGQAGSNGNLGFGSLGTAGAGSAGGAGGTANSVANAGAAGSNAGLVGGVGGEGHRNGDADNGQLGSLADDGDPGDDGANGGNGEIGQAGSNAFFTAPANDLTFAAGNAGGGGGGGGQGAGGQGGGSGGGATSGSGGGGGGGVDGDNTSWGCVLGGGDDSDAPGGAGGGGGRGGYGGLGGAGASAANGGVGGSGGNGGGALVLAASGLLQFTGQIDISAGALDAVGEGDDAVEGSAGETAPDEGDSGAPEDGEAGENGGTANWWSGNVYCENNTASSGDGADGGNGGTGGDGGAGGASGAGADGGTGGYGTPGMLKLQGSVVLASSGTVIASNGDNSVGVNRNGRFTLISNMDAANANAQLPAFTAPAIQHGTSLNNAVLTGSSPYLTSGGTPLTAVPNIPQLTEGPATSGFLPNTADYYNKASVDALVDAGQAQEGVQVFKISNTPFGSEWAQVVVVNHRIVPVSDYKLTFDPDAAGPEAPYQEFTVPDIPVNGKWTTLVPYNTTWTTVLPIFIGYQPRGGITYEGESFAFLVSATGGNSTLNYQWYKDDVAIDGVENPTALTSLLVVNPVEVDDTGEYYCVVSDNQITKQSMSASLTVYAHLSVVTQPDDGVRFTGEDFILYVAATGGYRSINYEWMKEDATGTPVAIPGAPSTPFYQFTVTDETAGVYYCRVFDEGGDEIMTDAAVLSVDPLGVMQQPMDTKVYTGDAVELQVVFEGGKGEVTMQWYRAGDGYDQLLNGEISDSLLIAPADPEDSGRYFCRITDESSKTTVNTATASVLVADHMTVLSQPISLTASVDTPASFTVNVAGGLGSITYIWKNGTGDQVGVNAPVLAFDSLTEEDAGTYYVEISDAYETLVSEQAVLTVDTSSASVPLAGGVGLSLLSVLAAASGAVVLRRRKK